MKSRAQSGQQLICHYCVIFAYHDCISRLLPPRAGILSGLPRQVVYGYCITSAWNVANDKNAAGVVVIRDLLSFVDWLSAVAAVLLLGLYRVITVGNPFASTWSMTDCETVICNQQVLWQRHIMACVCVRALCTVFTKTNYWLVLHSGPRSIVINGNL